MEQFCKTVPNFLTKLWVLVDDVASDHVIHWSKEGHSFQIMNEETFSNELLPKYFKHNRIASFIRQLNMYGFRKVFTTQNEKSREEKQVAMEFQHPLFRKGGASLLENIKRKDQKLKTEDTSLSSDELHKIVTEMQELKDIQSNMDARYEQMKQNYSQLHLEMTSLRKKYSEQQQLFTQVLHCILDLMNGSQTALKKRKRSISFIPEIPDSEWDHQYLHIPDEKKKEAMEILKDGYEVVEDKYKSLLDKVLAILKESQNLISPVDQPSGDDGKDSSVAVSDTPMNEEDSLTIQLGLTIPVLQEQVTEESREQEPKDMSLELELSSQDSTLKGDKSDTLCNNVINSDKTLLHHTEESLVEPNLLCKKTPNDDFDHVNEPSCYELPVLMTDESEKFLNVDVMAETNSLSLMENEREGSLLEANGEKDKTEIQCMEEPQLLLLDGASLCDFGENFPDSNDLLLDGLKNTPDVSSALCDHDYAATPPENIANTFENIVPQLPVEEASKETDVFPFFFFDPDTDMF